MMLKCTGKHAAATEQPSNVQQTTHTAYEAEPYIKHTIFPNSPAIIASFSLNELFSNRHVWLGAIISSSYVKVCRSLLRGGELLVANLYYSNVQYELNDIRGGITRILTDLTLCTHSNR